MAPVDSKRRAVVIAAVAEDLEALVTRAGYEVVGTAVSAVNGEQLMRHLTPDVAVVANELVGESGWNAMPHLKAASPDSAVLLVVTEHWVPRDVGATGMFAVVTHQRLGELVTELDHLDEWIDAHDEPTSRDDRRGGRERRLHQDWTKVGWERRNHDRRAA